MPATSRARVLACLVTLITVILIPRAAFSQRAMWPDGPKMIQPGWFYTAIHDGRGGAVILLGNDVQQVLQRVDNRGNRMWGDGVPVPWNYYPGDHMLAGDEQHGFFVVTTTYSTSSSQHSSVEVRKLNAKGHVGWIQSLTRVPSDQGQIWDPPSVLNDGSIVVLFTDHTPDDHYQTRMQRLSSTGRRLLGDSGVAIGGLYESLLASTVAADGTTYTVNLIWGQETLIRCFGPTGKPLWTCPIPTIDLGGILKATVTPLADYGIICVWGNISGAYGHGRGILSPRMLRFSRTGKPLWGQNGIAVFPKHQYYSTCLGVFPDKQSILVWGQYGQDIIANKYDMFGKPQWRDEASVCSYPYPYTPDMPDTFRRYRTSDSAEAIADDSGGAVFSWLDGRDWEVVDNQWKQNCYVTRLDRAGRPTWTDNGARVPNTPLDTRVMVSTMYGNTITCTVSDGNGGLLVFGYYRADQRSAEYVAMQRVIQSQCPPSTPTVVDEGRYSYSLDKLTAWVQSVDTKHRIVEYDYGVTSDSFDVPDMVPWTSNGTNQQVSISGLSLRADISYYLCARAKNSLGLWSSLGWSDGISPVERVSSLAEAVTKPVDWRVQPPPVTVVSTDGDYWFVTDTPDGPAYRIDAAVWGYDCSAAQPGDVFSVVCTADDWYEGGRYFILTVAPVKQAVSASRR